MKTLVCAERFAFVEFENEAAAESVLNNKEGYELNGRQLFVDRVGGGSKGGARTPSNNRQSFGSGGNAHAGTRQVNMYIRSSVFHS